ELPTVDLTKYRGVDRIVDRLADLEIVERGLIRVEPEVVGAEGGLDPYLSPVAPGFEFAHSVQRGRVEKPVELAALPVVDLGLLVADHRDVDAFDVPARDLRHQRAVVLPLRVAFVAPADRGRARDRVRTRRRRWAERLVTHRRGGRHRGDEGQGELVGERRP